MAEHDPHTDAPALPRSEGTPAPTGQTPVPALRSETLFAGRTELHIEHRGTLYRLRQTALGKLILTK